MSIGFNLTTLGFSQYVEDAVQVHSSRISEFPVSLAGQLHEQPANPHQQHLQRKRLDHADLRRADPEIRGRVPHPGLE
jgi:hypothetical protein